MPKPEPILFENAEILFRNFTGKEGKFNREGDRNFCLMLDPTTAEQMDRDGWNVKTLRPREDELEEDPSLEGRPYVQVSLKYGRGRPPQVVMITSRGRTNLSEDEVEVLDYADIRNVDLIINPYEWAVSGNTGLKAYLKSIYVTINEDELALKYADLEQVPAHRRTEDE